MKEIKLNEIKDMTESEAIDFFGQERWQKMHDTKLLTGITGEIRNGKFILYANDLKNAYKASSTNRVE